MKPRAALAALALALALPAVVPAEERAEPAPRMKIGGISKEEEAAAERYFTNTELVDQDGRTHRFYQDLLKGRKVLINFAFTSCSGVCPAMTANLARAQEILARRGEKVTLLTITVDPENDTPAALKRFAAKFKAGAGWHFLTGTPERVGAVLKRLGGDAKRPSDHTAVLLVGNTSTGMWAKTVATERPEIIAHLVQHIDDPT